MLEERKRYIIGFKDIPAARAKMPELAPAERINGFDEIEQGFTEEQARREAKRCLSCRRCLGCKLCLAACEREAIDFTQREEQIELEVEEIIVTPGALRYPDPLDDRFTCGSGANLLTDMEFERVLDPQGPYGGLILRPSDGEIPRKLGFILPDGGKPSRGSLDCLLKAAAAVHKKIEGSDVWLFLSPPTELIDDHKYLSGGMPQVNIKRCLVESVTSIAETGNVVVQYREDNETRTERFHMVVVSTNQRLPDTVRRLADQLKLRLAPLVEPTEICEPVPAGRNGILIAGGIAAAG